VNVLTLWGVRKGFEVDMPELMEAWDIHSIANWPEGWDEACAKARTSWGDDLVAWRIIELEVPSTAVLAAFAPARIEAAPPPSSRQEPS
jgi:hypothetical protein